MNFHSNNICLGFIRLQVHDKVKLKPQEERLSQKIYNL